MMKRNFEEECFKYLSTHINSIILLIEGRVHYSYMISSHCNDITLYKIDPTQLYALDETLV